MQKDAKCGMRHAECCCCWNIRIFVCSYIRTRGKSIIKSRACARNVIPRLRKDVALILAHSQFCSIRCVCQYFDFENKQYAHRTAPNRVQVNSMTTGHRWSEGLGLSLSLFLSLSPTLTVSLEGLAAFNHDDMRVESSISGELPTPLGVLCCCI